MNKKILGASAAATVLAAMPLVGVFAADGDVTSVTDTVTITVAPSCTLGVASTGANPSKSIANGATDEEIEGSKFSVSCNASNGWRIMAEGAGDESYETKMATADKTHSFDTNATLSNETSAWAFKATGTGVESTYKLFAAVPAEATKIASGAAPVSENSIEITYGVSIGKSQDAGTYVGKVKYTLMQGQSE